MTTTLVTAGSATRAIGVIKTYGEGDAAVHALNSVDVSLQVGHFTAIMGPSGSGKSTLLHVLAGLDRPSSGEIYLGDTEITSLNDKALTLLRRDQIGFIFQAFNLLPTPTAAENIELPMRIAGRKPDAVWVASIVATLGLADRLHHKPSELFGGQQQRVAAGRAEPTGARRGSRPGRRAGRRRPVPFGGTGRRPESGSHGMTPREPLEYPSARIGQRGDRRRPAERLPRRSTRSSGAFGCCAVPGVSSRGVCTWPRHSGGSMTAPEGRDGA